MDPSRWLVELADEIRVCTRCPLAQTRTYAVPGEGNPRARVLFIGEGPGEQEDLSGRPFVGLSGQLLSRELENIGILRDDVFITNIVKCRPPGNRVPREEETAACDEWLMAQIALIEPKFIVLVGGAALQTLLSKEMRITRSRSRVYRKDGILFVPIFHPSAALRTPSVMAQFLQDLAYLKELLERDIGEDEIIPLGVVPPPLPKSVAAQEGAHGTAGVGENPVVDESGNLSLF